MLRRGLLVGNVQGAINTADNDGEKTLVVDDDRGLARPDTTKVLPSGPDIADALDRVGGCLERINAGPLAVDLSGSIVDEVLGLVGGLSGLHKGDGLVAGRVLVESSVGCGNGFGVLGSAFLLRGGERLSGSAHTLRVAETLLVVHPHGLVRPESKHADQSLGVDDGNGTACGLNISQVHPVAPLPLLLKSVPNESVKSTNEDVELIFLVFDGGWATGGCAVQAEPFTPILAIVLLHPNRSVDSEADNRHGVVGSGDRHRDGALVVGNTLHDVGGHAERVLGCALNTADKVFILGDSEGH
mmetsp:Transcript_16642/g.23547  ORF Transcript_16642/g.23547 Transcript_16642/m.23547 type:complete len:300 (-) Transcript_16642:68-967(-)